MKMVAARMARRWCLVPQISRVMMRQPPASYCTPSGQGVDADHKHECKPSETIGSKPPPPQERNKLLVLGGNGFVGTHVCQEALNRRLPVMSLSRSGPPAVHENWMDDVTWILGNLLEPEKWREKLKEVSAVVSCVGGFGSNETMRKINGDANIAAIDAALEEGVKRFVYISALDFGFPSFFLTGYYEGKRAAESALQAKFPYGGVILRPGFIYGPRQVGNVKIPLNVVGGPLEMVLRNAKGASQIPIIGPLFIPPVKVTAVAKTAVRAATDNAVPPGILDVWNIIRLGDS